jgi:hypothetical protein
VGVASWQVKQLGLYSLTFWRMKVQISFNGASTVLNSLPGSRGEAILGFFLLWWLLVSLGLWLHHSSHYLCCHIAFCVWSDVPLPPSSEDVSHCHLGSFQFIYGLPRVMALAQGSAKSSFQKKGPIYRFQGFNLVSLGAVIRLV